jgi:hypothetical protein
MAKINTVNNRQVIDYMARDYESFKQEMIDLIPSKLPNWTDRSEADFGIVLIEIFAYMADILSYYQDRIANESFLATAQERRSVLQHLRLIGYELAPAAPASAELTLTFDNSQSRTVDIRRGDQFSTKSTKDRPSVIFEYANRTPIVINLNELELHSGGEGKKIYKFAVEEGRLIKREILGTSDGKPNQRYKLAQPRLIRGSLDVFVEETPGLQEPWELRETLLYSRSDEKHFVIEINENDITTVIFGDDIYGKIPPTAQITATYRVGGGRIGNVLQRTNDTIANAPALTALATVSNETAATGGEERESIENAIRFAPLVFKSNQRAVTVEDYLGLARKFPGVVKARAEAGNWNRIHLFIAPSGGGSVSDVMKKDLLTYFEDKRMMTTQIEIKDPDYVPIFITARVVAKPFAFKADVKADVKKAIKAILDFDVVDFKATLFLSKVYEAIEAIPGVENVFVSQFRARTEAVVTDEHVPGYDADKAIETGGRIALGDNEIPIPGYPEFIDVTVEGGL